MSRQYIFSSFGGMILLALAFILTAIAPGCKTEGPPTNPFDSIDYGTPPPADVLPDSGTITGLHQYIFSRSCSVPGCHDGFFEPDFRTVQSSYSTLVYQPVIKNTPDQRFEQRVIPNDVENSWLYHRVTTIDSILGRMPLYDQSLTPGQLKAIRDWINAGAPDMFGNVPSYPNSWPNFYGLAAFVTVGPVEYRVDTIRSQTDYAPFGTRTGMSMTVWFGLYDDSTAIGDLQNTRVEFSREMNGFPGSKVIAAEYVPSGKLVPNFAGQGNDVQFFWKVVINTADFPLSKVTYMRLYTDDGSHAEEFEFPRAEHPAEYKTYMSFYVAP